MPRRSGRATGQLVYHVLNRAVQNTIIFISPDDFRWFLELLDQHTRRFGLRILAYCIMPNHWHLVLWPDSDGALSPCIRELAGSHARLWRVARGTEGRGAVYQGRFKAIAVQCDAHLMRLCRYVERNAARARLVERAEHWEWSSASPLALRPGRPLLSPWPIEKPSNWLEYLNDPCYDGTLRAIREAIRRSRHFGDDGWRETVCGQLGWRSGNGPGRPVERRGDGCA